MAPNTARTPKPTRLHAALAAGVAALMLVAGIGWWLSRPAELLPAVAAMHDAVPLRAGPTAHPAALMPSTPAAAGAPPNASVPPPASGFARPTTPPFDDLQKVLQALDGGTPQEALDAAHFLALCPLRQQIVDAVPQRIVRVVDQESQDKWRSARSSVRNTAAPSRAMTRGCRPDPDSPCRRGSSTGTPTPPAARPAASEAASPSDPVCQVQTARFRRSAALRRHKSLGPRWRFAASLRESSGRASPSARRLRPGSR